MFNDPWNSAKAAQSQWLCHESGGYPTGTVVEWTPVLGRVMEKVRWNLLEELKKWDIINTSQELLVMIGTSFEIKCI